MNVEHAKVQKFRLSEQEKELVSFFEREKFMKNRD